MLALKREAVDKISRQDAFSVFGSFESGSTVRDSAHVGIGKVFATGVASQHLSEGLGELYRRSATACYDAVAKVGGGTDAATLERMLAGCRAGSK
jgi:hypothetical protein